MGKKENRGRQERDQTWERRQQGFEGKREMCNFAAEEENEGNMDMSWEGKRKIKRKWGEKEERDPTVPEKSNYARKNEQRGREWNLDLILWRSVEVSFAMLSQLKPRRTFVEYAITYWMKNLTSCFGQFLLTTCFRASLASIKAVGLLNESQWWHLTIFSYTNSLNSIEINANPLAEAIASSKTRDVSNCCGAVIGIAGI